MGQPAAPGQENKEQQQVSEAQKLQTERAAQDNAFKAKPFEYVTKKWQDQIRQNETQFNDAVDGLRGYELALIKSLAEIEKIENQSVHVKNAYKAKKTGEKERKKLWKEKEEEKAAENRNLKAAISRRNAATQTLLALQGKDPVPKVGNLYLKWAE